MLTVNPRKRITADQALKCPWICVRFNFNVYAEDSSGQTKPLCTKTEWTDKEQMHKSYMQLPYENFNFCNLKSTHRGINGKLPFTIAREAKFLVSL